MDAITLGLQGQQARKYSPMRKYAKLSEATITMMADDMDVHRNYISLMDEITILYHQENLNNWPPTHGWNWYRLTTALRELAQGE